VCTIVQSLACAAAGGMLHCQVLGTFITEWDAGKAACGRLFASEAAAECCAHQLAAIASWHGFEGWLINIENELDQGTLPHLLSFLR
jgi:mannosyl-glycoprotein endo-beta-N-acetylglucosaminidase